MIRLPTRARFTPIPVEQTDGSAEAWFEVAVGGNWDIASWRVAYRIRPQADQVIIVEVRLLPHFPDTGPGRGGGGSVPEGGIMARQVREEILPGTHVHQLLPEYLAKLDNRPAEFEPWLDRLGYNEPIARRPAHMPIPPGPKGRTDRGLAAMAQVYAAECSRGVRSPVKETAKAFGIMPSAARDALHKARERGVLTRTESGRAGGQLTPYGKRLLSGTLKKGEEE